MKLLAAALSLILAPTTVLAQNQPQPTWIQVGDWTLTPIVAADNSGVQVIGFLALGDKTVLSGSNITSIWYHRVAEDVWDTKTWDSVDQWEAIKYVKGYYKIGDAYDCVWPTTDLNTNGVSTEIPKEYLEGLKLDDPLVNDVINSEDRDALVTSLVAFGYEAADVPFERKSETPCDTSIRLTGLAVGVEAEAASADPYAGAGLAAEYAYLAAKCAPPCDLASWTIRTVGAWTSSGPWALTGSGATSCTYTQPMTQTITSIRFVRFTNCIVLPVWTSTDTNTGTQSITCPNTGGTCPATPNCLGTITPAPVVPTPDLPWYCHWLW